ncbi:MAG TPA: shikimate dehydrogenase [Alcaligenaceae bacterium]|nr:shikimate dehydrogenase [Alcaligenaceae bacterium]
MTSQQKSISNSNQPARFAVIGNPVKHSRSPAIHRMFGEQTGIALEYDRIEAPLDQFEQSVRTFFEQGGRGLNVTVPFKLQAWKLSEKHLSHRAQSALAVNTLWMQNNELHGCNTDGIGLVQDLKRLEVKLSQSRILMIGAGGAARGVMGPLLETGCRHLRVVNRTASRAIDLVKEWKSVIPQQQTEISAGGLDQASIDSGWDLVINASASSLGDAPPDVPGGLYAKNALAYDMMYGAQPTPFMTQATRDGAQRTSDGLGMLVSQAAESFFIWNGIRPKVDPVLLHIRNELQYT